MLTAKTRGARALEAEERARALRAGRKRVRASDAMIAGSRCAMAWRGVV